jgi:hypothetical protein
MANNIYRDREKPYTNEGLTEKQQAMRVYFQTHQPGEWRFQPDLLNAFTGIYGETAKYTVINHMTVPENNTASWVTPPVFSDPDPVAVDVNIEHKGQHKVSTPFGDKWVDDVVIVNTAADPAKYSDGERAILAKLDELRKYIATHIT